MSKKSAKDNVSENFKRFLLVSLEVVIDDPIENGNHGQSIATYFDPALSFHDYRDYQKLKVDFTEIFKLLKEYVCMRLIKENELKYNLYKYWQLYS